MFYFTANHLARLLIILLLIICTACHSYAYNADNAFNSDFYKNIEFFDELYNNYYNDYNPASSNNPCSRHTYTASIPAMQDDLGDINGNTMAAPLNVYSTYDTNPYLCNTPPLPSNNGYFAYPYINTFAPQQPQQLHHTQHIAPAHAQYRPYATQPIAPAQAYPHAQYNNQNNQNNYYNAYACVIPVQPSPYAHTYNTYPSISPKTVIDPYNNVQVRKVVMHYHRINHPRMVPISSETEPTLYQRNYVDIPKHIHMRICAKHLKMDGM